MIDGAGLLWEGLFQRQGVNHGNTTSSLAAQTLCGCVNCECATHSRTLDDLGTGETFGRIFASFSAPLFLSAPLKTSLFTSVLDKGALLSQVITEIHFIPADFCPCYKNQNPYLFLATTTSQQEFYH